ncbi:MAG TPA: copper transporter [Actinomycetota bacterium]
MINFRYHLASLIAVFLALGLGIVAGSTFVSPATVRALNNSLRRIDTSNKDLQTQNDALAQTNRDLLRYAEFSRNLLVQGKLAGKPVVLVSFDTTPGSETSQMATTLVAAGAKLQGTLTLSSNLALADDASRGQAATVVGGGLSGTEALQAALARQVSDALAGKTPGVLQRLIDAGLATRGPGVAGDAQQPPAALATPGTAVIFLAPAQPVATAKPGPDLAKAIVLPVIRALSSAQVPVAVGEDGSPLPLLAQVRQDSSLRVVTVDTIDQPMGQAAVVLGLAEALSTNAWGAYGSGPGASAPLPTPPAPATPTPSLSASLSRK